MAKKIVLLFFIVLFGMLTEPAAVFAESDPPASSTLRMALLPIPDVLPVYVAEESGYFKEAGIHVDILPVGSAIERDQLMQAGRIDGMINEVSGAAAFNREQPRVKIVSIARAPLGNSPLFRILAAPGSPAKEAKDLAGVPIGISVNTVIEYISTRMLGSEGLSASDIVYTSVPVLPERLQLLLSGQLAAVTLPDPLGASALKAGAVEIINDTTLSSVSASVVTFANEALVKKTQAVKGFMLAWDRASADLNADPEKFRALMLKKIRVPGNVREDFPIPPIPRKVLPTRAQWDDVMDWMIDKKLLEQALLYEDSVTSDFLPQ